MSSSKRILILGAGMYQCGLIERAKMLGMETHVVSRPGNFPGIVLAEHFHPIDTTDTPAVTALARRLGIDGVVTSGTDVAIPTLGVVAETLGLPRPNRQTAEIISHKDQFRMFQHRHGLKTARFVSVGSAGELPTVVRELAAPLIVKPVDSSGSRGVQVLDSLHLPVLEAAFAEAGRHSLSGRVCFEEKLGGVEIGGNALLSDGRIVFLAISQKFMEGFLVRGHAYPHALAPQQENAVRCELEKTCAALGYVTGALNFDVMVDGDSATVIELGARLGGNGLTEMISPAYNYDIQTDVLLLAVGDEPRGAPIADVAGCGSYVFGACAGGRLESFPSLEWLSSRVPSVYRILPAAKVGDLVKAFENNACQLGCVLFRLKDGPWQRVAKHLQAELDVSIAVAPQGA